MVPNRIVRYFFYFGYALAKAGYTPFSLFRTSLTHFYIQYLQHEFCLKNPRRYPETYGLN
ncbi:MAG: hypothetical protein ACE5ER_12950 [Nitrospinaceae bacterium]